MKGFFEFIRERGVVGFAVGFILGGAVTRVVTALVNDIVNPVLGIVLGLTKNLDKATLKLGPAKIAWGHFTSVLIDFVVIAAVVYFLVRVLGLSRLDKAKEEREKKEDQQKKR